VSSGPVVFGRVNVHYFAIYSLALRQIRIDGSCFPTESRQRERGFPGSTAWIDARGIVTAGLDHDFTPPGAVGAGPGFVPAPACAGELPARGGNRSLRLHSEAQLEVHNLICLACWIFFLHPGTLDESGFTPRPPSSSTARRALVHPASNPMPVLPETSSGCPPRFWRI
jgi:hypothetical protein